MQEYSTTSASQIYCCTRCSKISCMFCGIVCSIRSCGQMLAMATAQLWLVQEEAVV